MLSTDQKAWILKSAGLEVPPLLRRSGSTDEGFLSDSSTAGEDADEASAQGAEAAWQRTVDVLFSIYSAARAAKSLREAEEEKLMARLRGLR
jgi:hypothetical protein